MKKSKLSRAERILFVENLVGSTKDRDILQFLLDIAGFISSYETLGIIDVDSIVGNIIDQKRMDIINKFI